MKNLIYIIFFFTLGFSQTVGTTSDGKTVIINKDGTWEILQVESSSSYKEAFNMYVDGPWDYSDKYFKENLGHIMLDFNRGKKELVPLVELYKYWDYIHYGDSYVDAKADFNYIGEIDFGFFDFEDDGVNELIIEGSYRTAGYSGYFHIFEKIGNTHIYKIVLDFDSSGGFGLDTDSKLFYSIDGSVDYIICGACGHQISPSYHSQQKEESNREYKKRIEKEPITKFVSLYPDHDLNPYVNIAYRDGELFHPKQSFAKTTKYFDVMTFIKDEINWERMQKVKTEDYDKWGDRTLIDSKEFSYFFFNDDGTYETLSGILEQWYRPLIQNIMAYHYNSMKVGTYPNDKINLNSTKRIFYDIYKAPDVDKRWKELMGLLKLYPYKKL